MWTEVLKETGRWKSRWRIRVLMADERCSRAVLDFLTSTKVGGGCRLRKRIQCVGGGVSGVGGGAGGGG